MLKIFPSLNTAACLLTSWLQLICLMVAAEDFLSCTNAPAYSESDLRHYLFHRSNFSMDCRPVRNSRRPVNVDVDLSLIGIKDFHERQSTLVIDVVIDVAWLNEFLIWNTTYPYNCTPGYTSKLDGMWQPDLTLVTGYFNSNPSVAAANSAQIGNLVWINSSGVISFDAIGELYVNCDLDLAAFPFDTQICNIIIQSWQTAGDAIQIGIQDGAQSFARVPDYWTENQQWEIVANDSQIITDIYLQSRFKRAIFRILLRRKPLHYYVNVIIPGLLIGIVELVTFLLPIEEVVKVHISFTCLLAYSVFQTMIVNDMPKSSERVPLLSLYIVLQMAYIGVIAILGEAVIFAIVRKAELGESSMPPNWLFNFVIRPLGKVLFLTCHSNGNDANELGIEVLTKTNNKGHQGSESGSSWCRDAHFGQSKSQEKREKWLYTAEVVERINMGLYILAVTITPAVMFIRLPAEKTLNE